MNNPYIIAEIGSNFRNYEDCIVSIQQAKHAGADAVKFQLYTDEELYGFKLEKEMPGLLWRNWLPQLKYEADKFKIDFLCTAFSPDGYQTVNEYVSMHKVASAEATHLRILQKVKSFGKPVILSTGAKGKDDIHMALEVLKPLDVTLMYCVAAYPAQDIDLYQIHSLRGIFRTSVGYSDHSTDIETIPPLSFSHGGCMIEKHFTIIPEIETPDRPHSINPDQFKRMVFSIRERKYKPIDTPLDMYSDWKGPRPEEKPMVLRHNRRLIAIKDLSIGEELQEGINFGIYRSLKDDTRAAHPFMIDRFIGKKVKVEVKAGDGLWIEDISG